MSDINVMSFGVLVLVIWPPSKVHDCNMCKAAKQLMISDRYPTCNDKDEAAQIMQ